MKFRKIVTILLMIVSLHLFSLSGAADDPTQPITPLNTGIQAVETKVSPVGGISTGGGLSLEMSSMTPAVLTRQDYEDIYAQAAALLDEGLRFRLCQLQLQNSVETYDCPDDPNNPTDEQILDSYYADFNSGALLNAFCPNFDIDERGYCGSGDNIRNKLMDARRMFAALYLAHSEGMTFTVDPGSGPQELNIRATGLAGMLAATRELAYAHLIFGSEFAIDAFDYRYSIEGQAGSATCTAEKLERYRQSLDDLKQGGQLGYDYFEDADCIISYELNLLTESRQQYEHALELMTGGYRDDLAWPKEVLVGQLFTQREVELFTAAIENYATVIDAIAVRHRQLGDDTQAMTLYRDTYERLFVLTLPLIERAKVLYAGADDNGKTLLDSNALAVRSALELLEGRIREIENGRNVFGFTEDYVPVQSYFHMDDASDKLFDWARTANNEAIGITREFEINATQLNTEMANVRTSYQSRLVDICGEAEETPDNDPNNDFEECIGSGGSLMEQSWLNLASAALAMNLARTRIDSAVQQIYDIQARNAQIIEVKSSTGQTVAATTLAMGMARANQVTESTSTSMSSETFRENTVTKQKVTKPGLFSSFAGTPNETVTSSVELAGTAGPIAGAAIGTIIGGPVGGTIGAIVTSVGKLAPVFNGLFGSTKRTTIESNTTGERHSETHMTTVNRVFNPSEIEIANLQNVKEMALLVQDVTITGIETEFEVRNVLRQIAELQIQKDQASIQYNRAVSQQKKLVREWRYRKALYDRARADLQANYLANPAYRLLKSHKTEVATYQLEFAARQAYLTAKALEYHLADEVPFINDVFKVRHPAHLKAYLFKLEQVYGVPPSVNETNVEFSLRVLASGIRDQDISSAPVADRQQLIALRQQKFQDYLQEHIIEDANGNPNKLVLVFDTSLNNRPIDSTRRYNWRIAGAVTGSTDPSIDRCPVRKPYGVTVEILQGSQTLPNGMSVDLRMSGHTSTRKDTGEIVHYYPRLATLLPDEDLPDSIRTDLADAVADASIDVNNPENTISDFCNMSVASTNWIMEIPLADNQINYALFQDIKLKMWTYYYD